MKNKALNNWQIYILESLLVLNIFFWILAGVVGFAKYANIINFSIIIKIIAAFMLINACVMIWILYGVIAKKAWAYYFGIFYFLLNFILTFADQFGLADLIIFLMNLTIILLFFINKSYFSNNSKNDKKKK